MSWSIAQLKRWLDEIEPNLADLDPFALLGLTPAAAPADVQPAYHAVARSRHPDLFRTRLTPADFDRVVRVYSRITAAYADLRDPVRCAAIALALRTPITPAAPPPTPLGTSPTARPPRTVASATPAAAAPEAEIDQGRAMNPRALTSYRRAVGALQLGDRTTALLQLRMAIAADPSSTLLRAALADLLADS